MLECSVSFEVQLYMRSHYIPKSGSEFTIYVGVLHILCPEKPLPMLSNPPGNYALMCRISERKLLVMLVMCRKAVGYVGYV